MSNFRVRRSFTTGRAARPHGFTLAEVMVAIAVFAVIVAITMTLYQQLQKSFKQGENATAEQQNTRIAFDRMMADLRMAGFNYNPNGATRPDEQIEGMWTNAVTVRGDYDYETADANTPEPALAGGAFSVVSTGNDEIVTYALGKPSGAGGVSIQFQADVSAVPRDGTLQTVPINNVYLDMNSPPYTLYRITLKPGGTALSAMADKVPIADNIREMDVTYFDSTGAQITTMAQGMDDPNSLALRKKIAKINVRIVGMTQDPDSKYFDPADTNPLSQHFRKFDLTSDVTPRNLGFVGMQDVDLDKPTTPTGLAVCAGHCQGLLASWTANPANQGVIKYEVTSGAAITSMGSPQDAFATRYFVPNLTGPSYLVGVAGVDAAGNKSDPPAYVGPTTISDSTTPRAPSAGTATIGASAVFNQINLGWAAPTRNTTDLGCDASPYPIRDLKGYRLFRGATTTFDPNISAQVQITVDPNTITAGAATYSDPANPNSPTIVNCRPYFYKLRAEDLCGKYDPNTATGVLALNGSSTSSVKPSKPINATAVDMGNSSMLLSWNPVTTNVTPSPILIDKYKVFRTAIPLASDPNLATYSVVYDGTIASVGSPAYSDTNVPNIPGSQRYWYRISAHDDCINESDMSAPALVSKCNLGGSIQINMSPGGSTVTGVQTITVTVTGSVTPTQGQLIISDQIGGTVVLNQTSNSYPYTFTWNAGASPTVAGHTYTVAAAVTNNAGCTDTQSTGTTVGSVVACCITAANPKITGNTTLGSVTGGTKNNEVLFDIANTCAGNVTITGIDLNWDNVATSDPHLAAWQYQGQPNVVFSQVLNPALSGLSPTAVLSLLIAPLTSYLLPTTNNASNPLTVGYVFDHALVAKIKGVDVGDTIRTVYTFTVAGNPGTARCDVSVIADPNTFGITLCDPFVDPNCPGF